MINITVMPKCNDLTVMYKRAKTQEQRALLGYIVKYGFTSNSILGGAFNLLCDIQNSKGIYNLIPYADIDVADRIVIIAENAILGEFNKYAFSKKEIAKILNEIKGG